MRCFLAIELKSELKDILENLKKQFNLKGIKTVEKENLHITVKFLGDVDDKKLEEILESDLKIEKVISEIKGVGTFPNEEYIRVIWVGTTNLEEIFKNIDEKLFKLGFKKEKSYDPHITLGRVKFIENDSKETLKNLIEKNKHVDFGKVEINSISLMKSTLTKEGPVYETVKKWD
ncbi:RNA 2',3'-cyclic phosphodiesterase [Methanococcus maripaludis]|uniref:RNA 2',3'-cyclic phosphodiesterase n=2 Tax=Methanococcus maripaludis TaxID=39152 RepID=A0A7J9PHR8_METMI|nr:RNA 2',3'-cyclic phosphodiesterase [Methanococcus maripaludis]MBA2862775.1 2'-5' RNA ligase [Methanococcus maripaludis]